MEDSSPPPPPSLRSKAVAISEERNWLELPTDAVSTIFQKLGVLETLRSAQFVCSTWRSIARDPLLYRTIDMPDLGGIDFSLGNVCRQAVDYSAGQLSRIDMEYFGTDELLRCITDSTSDLQSLRLACCYEITDAGVCEVAEKLSQLEEVDITICNLSKTSLEAIGRCCPNLKSLKFNMQCLRHQQMNCDEEAFVIAETMPALRNLQLFGNKMSNDGLLAILDGCPHLESLDLRQCFRINLEGSLGSRCAQQFKHLKLPDDPIEDYRFDLFECLSLDEGYPSGISDKNFLFDDDYDHYDFSDGSDFAGFDFEGAYDNWRN